MVTVDPERDTQQVMADYMNHFDSSFIGLIGTPEQVAEHVRSRAEILGPGREVKS